MGKIKRFVYDEVGPILKILPLLRISIFPATTIKKGDAACKTGMKNSQISRAPEPFVRPFGLEIL